MRVRRLNNVQRRKIIIFLRCVVLSLFAWLIIAGTNKYTLVVKAAVEYVNIPPKKAFHSLQSDTVNVNIKMSGWDVLISKMKNEMLNVQVDLNSLKTRNFIVFSKQIGFINKQFAADMQVVSVSPDTLYFDFSKQTQRKVPLRVPTSITFRKQYGITGAIRTNPKYITITGPLEDVANIEYLETDSITGKNVFSDIRKTTNINRSKRPNISIYPKSTEVVIPVGELTEKVIELPIKVENDNRYNSVRIIPSKVSVTVMTSLKDYSKHTARDFEAIVDLSDWEENSARSLPIILTKFPDYVKIVKIEPQNVDFFVRK